MTSSAGRERVDLGRVAAEVGDGLAHGGEVDDAGHAGEVLHDHAGRRELDLGVGLGVLVPGAERADVVGGDVGAVLGAQEVLEQHLEAEREVLAALDRREPVDLVGLVTDLQLAVGVEAVVLATACSFDRASSRVSVHQFILTSRYLVGRGRACPCLPRRSESWSIECSRLPVQAHASEAG